MNLVKENKISIPTIILNNKVRMPALGLGVYQIPKGSETENAVLSALKIGYRLIDTAALYGNEQDVGNAIRKSGIAREEIFITTKLHPTTLFNVEKSFDKSLQALGLKYIDLYLIHIPTFRKKKIWKTLEKIYRQGQVRAIGVSNFTVKDLENLLKSTEIITAVNQVEFHPFLYHKELLEYCKSKGILLEAHSPLTHGKRLDTPLLQEIAQKYQKSVAQLLIRWILQHGLATIPKTTSENHMRENANVFDFEINEADMTKLNNLNENYHVAWFSRLADHKLI